MRRSPDLPGYTFEAPPHATLGACIDVQRQMSVHCMEVDYQRALEEALRKRRLEYRREVEVPIGYDDRVVTKRRVDLVIWDDRNELLRAGELAHTHFAFSPLMGISCRTAGCGTRL